MIKNICRTILHKTAVSVETEGVLIVDKQTIVVLFGGRSSEHEVSLQSATSVIGNLSRERYDILPVGITRRGSWLYYPGSVHQIASGDWEKHEGCCPALINPDRSCQGLLKRRPDGTYEQIKVDCVVPVLHGKNGEDGSVQGLLEIAGLAYVGSGVGSSAVCMDKTLTRRVLDSAGIRGAKWKMFTKSQMPQLIEGSQEIASELKFPIFVKPASAGSSVGITKAVDCESLREGIKLALKYDHKVICEQAVYGREVECAVLGNENPKASILGQIISCNDFYDYDAKYQSPSQLVIPARLHERITKEVQRIAILAYQTLECKGLARMDFFVDRNGRVLLNEPNTLPGFTEISMYPKLWEESGLPVSELLQTLIDLAIEEHKLHT